MKYILRYTTESNYFHFLRQVEKEFRTFSEVRDFLIANVGKIKDYKIYKLTDLISN